MLFGRREKPPLWRRIGGLWPSRGPIRPVKYLMKRVGRIRATPHAIAAGFAAGAAASFTPFLGFHFLLAFAIAWMLRGSMIAAAFGTAVGNPLTFPLIFAATYEVGSWILDTTAIAAPTAMDAEGAADTLMRDGILSSRLESLVPLLRTMVIGSVPLGLLAFLLFYVLVRVLVGGFQRRRAMRKELAETASLDRRAA